jgi:hypothetical protein
MTADLAQFLRARLDEEKLAAEEALKRTTISRRMIGGEMVEVATQPPEWRRSAWSPKRVLAEVDAKRQIIDWHLRQCTCEPCTADGDDMPNTGRTEGGFGDDCPTLRLLALPHASHPDFREEWRP